MARKTAYQINYYHIISENIQQSKNGRIGSGAIDELLQREIAIVVLVHLPEDLLGPLLRRGHVLVQFHHFTDHFVHCLLKG